MKTSPESIVEEALSLPRPTRALLAEKLLESLDREEGFEVSDAWRDEIKRRCAELDAGTVALVPAEKVFEDVENCLR